MKPWRRIHPGWFRLWIVATLIGVPALTIWDAAGEKAVWDGISATEMNICVDEELNNPTHPDALECGRRTHAYEAVFEREHMTAGAYWGWKLFGAFILDLILTLLLIGAFYIGRWVYRGFRPPAA